MLVAWALLPVLLSPSSWQHITDRCCCSSALTGNHAHATHMSFQQACMFYRENLGLLWPRISSNLRRNLWLIFVRICRPRVGQSTHFCPMPFNSPFLLPLGAAIIKKSLLVSLELFFIHVASGPCWQRYRKPLAGAWLKNQIVWLIGIIHYCATYSSLLVVHVSWVRVISCYYA